MWIIILFFILFLIFFTGFILAIARPDLFGYKKWLWIIFAALTLLFLILLIFFFFKHFAKDTTPPAISNIQATNITTDSTVINWITDELASSEVYYTSSSPVSIETALKAIGDGGFPNHSVYLSNLTASSTYFYIVASKDNSNNISTSTEQSFMTLSSLPFLGWANKQITSRPNASVGISGIIDIAESNFGFGIVWLVDGYGASNEQGLYLTIVDKNGDRVVQEDILVAQPTSSLLGMPKIVWNGLEFGVFWGDYFARFDANGNRLQMNTKLAMIDVERRQNKIMWNGSGYALFWEGRASEGGVAPYLSFMSSTGTILSNKILVSVDAQHVLEVAGVWNDNQYALAWSNAHANVATEAYLALFNASGTKMTSDISISNGAGSIESVYWNGNTFDVFWRNTSGNYMSKVSTSGSIVGAPVLVSASSRQIKWARKGDEYGAVSRRSIPDPLVKFTRFDNTGQITIEAKSVIDPEAVFSESYNIATPVIIASSQSYAIIWMDNRDNYSSNKSEIYFVTGP